ncbi:hypothetical protein JCM15457_2365 [Liquorilactobacillus sucicola DSM 21376 = JCM 15457]|uniref:Microbial-type PARG catalytic domain-containing protein n=1 Tax=Liquorilactobacillus sucicola DSM 21376 = JCM 15457 TaxID=1423806 RepID=A0A023CZN5_9LACO|nr:TIGR02452 family protein [Liquorilactobacillus sucicola]KRN07244.1 hypothetical protein FD15_GL000069 [Liquorilactobacillus sucicola DSM 21376 = JCM 15457]GAJ27378.1 hypothetical protein JCM15457_2365 [Liquorilactobacillus sucicola DSM 21376 = JCM 15457]
MDNTQEKRLQAIGHHTMNLYQIEMGKVKQDSQLIEKPLAETVASGSGKAEIKVINENILHRIKKVLSSDEKVGLLNFANPTVPGGHFLEGVNAQEQTICRNSFLYPELLKYRNSYYLENKQYPNDYYYNAKIIFARHIKILRDETEQCFLEGENHVDIVSSAAPNVTAMKATGMVIDQARLRKELKQKILQIIRQFKAVHERILILGAYGCGAFGNDSHTVAEAFKEVLERAEFSGSFETIYFDILDNAATLGTFKTVLQRC